MSGARGVPQGRDRNIADADLQAFKDRVDKLRAEGLPMSAISERLGTSATTIHHRFKRLKDLIAKEGEKNMANENETKSEINDQNKDQSPEKKHGSGFTLLSIVNELRTVRAAAFKAQLTKMIRPAGRGGFSKKQVEDMTSGFESGFTDVFVCLVDMGVIVIDNEK